MATIEELKAQLKAAQTERAAKALTPDELERAELRARIDEEREAAAEVDARRRADDLKDREAAAAAKAGTAYLVEGIDLVALFPFAKGPSARQFPTKGVIIVRSPAPETVDTVNREVEAKKKSIAAIMADLLCASTVDPDPDGDEAITLRSFCERYPDAAIQAASRARELGGAKTLADKRGR